MSKLILASGSPRRKVLLTEAGIQLKISVPEIDEVLLPTETPKAMVKRLSFEKAKKVSLTLKPTSKQDLFVLAADTTVVNHHNKNLGKPKNRAEAKRMLSSLQGKSHFVYTGYTLLKLRKNKKSVCVTRVIKTTVTFKKLSDQDIEFYLSFNESMDKAGAYAAQGAGVMLVEKMNGSFSNVVGLPLSQVLDDLKRLGFKVYG